jgi:predicted transcriptional regulator
MCYLRLEMSDFNFLTNHGHVLVCIARDGDPRLRDVAECVGITERAAQRIVRDLEEKGYISRKRVGRRNVYEIHPELPLRHELEQDVSIGKLLQVIVNEKRRGRLDAAA